MALLPDWDDQSSRALIHEPVEELVSAMSSELSQQNAHENLAHSMAEEMREQLRKGLNRRFWVPPVTPLIVVIKALELLYGFDWQEELEASDITSLLDTYNGPAVYLRADPK